MDLNELRDLLVKYWTAEKCGKHTDLANQHGMILLKNLLVSPEDCFAQFEQNVFKFMPFSKISWNDFLKRANLSEYLRPSYVHDALNVTTTRPAIGKGEFLFASCFKNIGFSNEAGDLVDLTNGAKIEFKGIRSNLSGDGAKYRQMNKSLMYSVFALFDTNKEYEHFNKAAAKEIDELLNTDPNKIVKVLELLQNISNSSRTIAQQFGKLYSLHPDLFNIVGAMQLYIYLHVQKASFLVMTNDQGFCCFKTPETPEEAYNIIDNLKLSTWYAGTCSMSIGI